MNFYTLEESVREDFLERELLFASADAAVNAEAAAAGQMKSSCGSPGCNDDCPWMYVGVDRVLPEDHECADPDAERWCARLYVVNRSIPFFNVDLRILV